MKIEDSSACIHRLAVTQRQPAAPHSIDRPNARAEEDRDPERNANNSNEQQSAGQAPKKRKPERPDLPAKMRFQKSPARLAALHVIDDNGNDRRQAKNKRADDRRRGRDADHKTQRVQRVNRMRDGDEGWYRVAGNGSWF